MQRKPNATTETASNMTAAEFAAKQSALEMNDEQLGSILGYKKRQIARFKSGEAKPNYLVRFAMRLLTE